MIASRKIITPLMKLALSKSLLCAVWAVVMPAAYSQTDSNSVDWPSKTTRIVVPYAAGGTSDTLGRLVAQTLQSSLKQGFVVDNKGGGGGVIGSMMVAKSAPDGYTLVVSGIGSHVIAPVLNKTMDPMADFTHIAYLGGPPLVLVVNPNLPVNSLKEFVAYAHSLKDGLSWGSPGIGTHGHLIGEMFAKRTGIKQTHINYKGAAPAIVDLIGNQIQATFTTYTTVSAFIKSGKAKAIAITANKRLADQPAVPTFAELGYPELSSTTWFSLSGPPGMSAGLVEKINMEVRRGFKTEAAVKQLAKEYIETLDWDAAALTTYMRSEIDRWSFWVKLTDGLR
jgi:tripartite-type tricarboxylate transporter receptor subunit TctC